MTRFLISLTMDTSRAYTLFTITNLTYNRNTDLHRPTLIDSNIYRDSYRTTTTHICVYIYTQIHTNISVCPGQRDHLKRQPGSDLRDSVDPGRGPYLKGNS